MAKQSIMNTNKKKPDLAAKQLRRMQELILAFCNSLFLFMKNFHPFTTSAPSNILLAIFHMVDHLADDLLSIVGFGGFRWLKPEGRRELATMLVRILHGNDKLDGIKAQFFVHKAELLLSHLADEMAFVTHFHTKVPLQFSFSLPENISSRHYLDMMIEQQPSLWAVVRNLIYCQNNVKVTIHETYLNHLWECALLTQLLVQIRERFQLTFQGIDCKVIETRMNESQRSYETDLRFQSDLVKLQHLRNMLSGLKVPVSIGHYYTARFKPSIVLSNTNFCLVISTDRGLTYWWKLKRGHRLPSVPQLMLNPMLDLKLCLSAAGNQSPDDTLITITCTTFTNQSKGISNK